MLAPTLQIRAGRRPVLILGGSWVEVSSADVNEPTVLLVDGKDHGEADGGGIVQSDIAPDGRAHALSLSTKITTGTLVLAYYEQVE
jgi:hypothetical protein